jgi:hypothetical protein
MREIDFNIAERLELAADRLGEIEKEKWDFADTGLAVEQTVKDVFANVKAYFDRVAEFLVFTYDVLLVKDVPGNFDSLSTEELKTVNNILYEDILPENYGKSYANPDFAVKSLGEYGQFFSAVYAELRGQIVYAYEANFELYVANLELFLELYSIWNESYREMLETAGENNTVSVDFPKLKYMKEAYYYHIYDYADISVAGRTLELIDSEANTFARDIVMDSNLEDIRYLYRYGEYIGENEIKTAEWFHRRL